MINRTLLFDFTAGLVTWFAIPWIIALMGLSAFLREDRDLMEM